MSGTFTYHGKTLTTTINLGEFCGVHCYSRGYSYSEVVFCCTFRYPYVTTLQSTKGHNHDILWFWETEASAMEFTKVVGAAIKAHWDARGAPVVQAVAQDPEPTGASAKQSRVVPVAVMVDKEDEEKAESWS